MSEIHAAELNRNVENDQLFRKMFEQGPLGMAIADRQLRLLKVNPKLCRMLGYREDELVGRTIAEITHPEDVARNVALSKRLLAGALPHFSVEKRYLRKNGESIWGALTVSLITDKHGEPVYALGMIADISARKQTELALAQALAWQQAIFEGSRDAIFITDAHAHFIEVNRAACELTGFSRAELLAMRIPDLHEKIDLQAYHIFHSRILDGEEIITEAKILRKDGSKVDAEFNNRRIIISGVTYMHTVARDLTERRRAEEELRKLSHAVEQSPVSVIITDTRGHIEYVNTRFCQLTGYSEAEVIGKQPSILRSGLHTVEFYQHLWKTITAGNEWRGEFCNKKKNGEIYWESASICGIRNQQGKITHFVAVKEDITDRKRIESDLKKSEERYRTLFEVSQDAVLITQPDGKILDINPAGVEMFGYHSKEDFFGIGNAAALYKNPTERAQLINQLLAHGSIKDQEIQMKKKDGASLEVLLTSATVQDENGEPLALYAILHDLTKRKKIERQLLHAQKMETIATLVSGIAHDFNNLLVVILGNLEFALEGLHPDHPSSTNLQRVEEAALKARDLITKLLSFSRREALKPQPLNLNAAIKDALGVMQTIVGKNIIVETRLARNLNSVLADPLQVHQILMNLCVNARDAMPEGGRIFLTTKNIGAEEISGLLQANGSRHFVQLTVSDTGMGIDPKIQSRLFEPFFTTKDIGKGTGLGLSVVYGIVKQHNGHIEVESGPGLGATFKIYLPASAPPENGKSNRSNYAKTKETIHGENFGN
jgi:PAS domain S-box-containing protein